MQLKQIMYDHITQLTITANPQLIHDLNNDIFVKFYNEFYKHEDGFQQYISLWKHMYNGKKDREDFPNINKSLQKISTQSSIKLSAKLSKYLNQFNKNIQKLKQKKVQFFEDFEDSSLSESFQDESRITEIVYMDIMELKAIRQKVQNQPLSEQNCAQYLIKMKTFLNLRPKSLNNQLLIEFNKQKVWARHFIDHHSQYLKRPSNFNNQSLNSFNNPTMNKTNQIMISLSKDQQSIEQPPKGFYKQKNNLYGTHYKSYENNNPIQNLGYKSHEEQNLLNLNKKSRLESEIKNFTINEVPLDQSKFTQRSSKILPVFNNSVENNDNFKDMNRLGQDGIIQKSNYYDKRMIPDENYKQMSFNPKQIRSKSIKNVPISRPKPEETLPLDQSILNNNYSIPQEVVQAPSMKYTPTKVNNTFGYQGNINNNRNSLTNNKAGNLGYDQILDGSSSNAKDNFSSSNNPFANSKTNYYQNNQNSNQNRSPYEEYKQIMRNSNHKRLDLQNNPIRTQMAQNDLDSQNMDQDIMMKPHYQKKLKFQNNNTRSVQLPKQNKFQNQGTYSNNLGFPQTHQNFNKNKATQNIYTNFRSQQNIISDQHSPRSHTGFSKSSNKKRLSQLTSQKKMRKTQASKQEVLNGPQQYVYRPYSIHFNRDEQSFNNFKRNCLQDKFTVYASPQLVIQCTLKKINNSKLQLSVRYQNQIRRDLQLKVMYKIPKCFKIQKVSKIHRKFVLKYVQTHVFNLNILQFPLETCLLDLSYYDVLTEQGIQNIIIPLPVTIKNFTQILVSSKQEWLTLYEKLNSNSVNNNSNNILPSLISPFKISKTFELNRSVIQPSQMDFVLGRQFIKIGSIEGYSVQQYGSICSYRNLNSLVFLIRISIRIDHILTIQILSQNQTSENQRDFMKYYLELMVTLMGKYRIN